MVLFIFTVYPATSRSSCNDLQEGTKENSSCTTEIFYDIHIPDQMALKTKWFQCLHGLYIKLELQVNATHMNFP